MAGECWVCGGPTYGSVNCGDCEARWARERDREHRKNKDAQVSGELESLRQEIAELKKAFGDTH